MVKRCVSACSKLKEDKCVKPCSFVGKKYCRLSASMKMIPPDCRVVKKKMGSNTVLSKKVTPKASPKVSLKVSPKVSPEKSLSQKPILTPEIRKTMNDILAKNSTQKSIPKASTPKITKALTPKNRSLKLKEFKEKRAAKKIALFMKQNETRRKDIFGDAICSDNGICVGFGKQKKRQSDFFEFDNFKYATYPTKTLGKPSANGFVKQFTYSREGFVSYAVLKSTQRKTADNIAYEYLVGKYLNEVSKRFPIFVETYGLYTFEESYNRNLLKILDHNTGLTPLDPQNISKVCSKSSTLCVLIQHLKDAVTLSELSLNHKFIVFDAHYVFYQIYFALSQLRKDFTHYDLHMSNVMLYEPVKGGHIEYHYHLPGKVITFKSIYIVKIIDYGRSFFNGNEEYYDKVCKEKACDPNCGHYLGFSYFNKDFTKDKDTYYINALHKHESHDLRLLYEFRNNSPINVYRGHDLTKNYVKLFDDVVYGVGLATEYKRYSTMEDLTHDHLIHNVTDANKRFEQIIDTPLAKEINDYTYEKSIKIGELHVYSDGRELEFIQEKNI
jgi:hypothetical protein